MSFFESILYGFISGLTEFLPVSSQGHQAVLLQLFGLDAREPVRDLLVHIGILSALLAANKPFINYLQREMELMNSRRRPRGERRGVYELQLLKMSVLPLLGGFFAYLSLSKLEHNMVALAIVFVFNGIILIIPEYIRHGNKDSRFMTGWDGILLGLSGAVSAVPGISRIGMMNLYTVSRGVDRSHGMNWAFVLSIPILLLLMGFDIVNLFVLPLGTVTFSAIFMYIVSAVAAFCGGYFGVLSLRYLAVHTGFAGFAYYSWGIAMFSFVLYLIV